MCMIYYTPVMTIEKWLKTAIAKLEASSVPTATLDAEVLLADDLHKDRSWLHANPEHTLQGATLQKLDEQISQRAEHVPLAYIRGRSEFYGREFVVTPDTLQPRPETETMIDFIKKINPSRIVDVGTGSGCIAITAKLELPESEVTAVDISEACLQIAKRNAQSLNADIYIDISDLLQDVPAKKLMKSTLCCNLPYVPDDFSINTAASHEPKIALFGGIDGLDYYRQLFEQLMSLPEQFRPIHVLTESLPNQHETLTALALQANYSLKQTDDFIQHFRSEDVLSF